MYGFGYAGLDSVGLKTWIIRTLSVGFVGEGVGKEKSSAMVIFFMKTLTLMFLGFFLDGRGARMILVDPLEVDFQESLGRISSLRFFLVADFWASSNSFFTATRVSVEAMGLKSKHSLSLAFCVCSNIEKQRSEHQHP